MMKAKVFGAATGLALAVAPSAPAEAQFAPYPYPLIIVPPPPAQNLVMPPKPAPKPAQFAERSRNWIWYCTVSGPQHLKRPVQRTFKAARDNQEPPDSRGKL